jgi:hypothetical protein
VPFTLAHTAAALPFRRTPLIWSALIVGTMAPDFEYFLRMQAEGCYGHTLQGAFIFTLPLALLTLWLFHAIVKIPLVQLCPYELQKRLIPYCSEFRFGGLKRFALLVISILVGVFTHIVWDSFTHTNTVPYRTWPFLRQRVNVPLLRSFHIYKLLQHGSTILGICLLCVWIWAWWRSAAAVDLELNSNAAPKITLLVIGCVIALVGGLVRAALATSRPFDQIAVDRFIGLFVVTTIAVAWWELVVFGVWRLRCDGKFPLHTS